MAWAGVQVGRTIDAAASPLARPADNAGRHGARIGNAMVSTAMKR